ncbi:MAG TPA: hypothetical protein EYN86_04785 [Planctomycetes bacterium]|nr:hypothetical protein [Planctomycetota bacterium]
MFIERCVTSLAEARIAVAQGASRLELCSALEVDGLTANRKVFLDIKRELDIEVRVMLRNSHPGFEVSAASFVQLADDAEWFKQHHADGFVFGFVRDSQLLETPSADLLHICAPLPCTFHKAFDTCKSLPDSLERLIDLGFASILTSGGYATALEGASCLTALIQQADGRIEVISAGKVRLNDVDSLSNIIKTRIFHCRV